MTWTPKVANPTGTGSVAFQNGSAGGSGGTGGFSSTGGRGGGGGTTGGAGGGAAGRAGGGEGGGTGGAGGTMSPADGAGPCDIHAAAKTRCVGAYSMVRALYQGYNGPLYQGRKTADKTVKDISVLAPGGYADSKVQDDFCTSGCTIAKLYDRSPNKNHLPLTYPTFWLVASPPAPASYAVATESNPTGAKITIGNRVLLGFI